MCRVMLCLFFFFFNDTATTEIYTLSPTRRSSDLRAPYCWASLCAFSGTTSVTINSAPAACRRAQSWLATLPHPCMAIRNPDRKSTRLNSSHVRISYAVFCLQQQRRYVSHLTTPSL